MAASRLPGRLPDQPLSRLPGAAGPGGGSACIAPTIQPDATVPPFLIGFIAAAATFDGNPVVGFSFGADPLVPDFGTLLSPTTTGLDALSHFHRTDLNRTGYLRMVTTAPYAPEVAGIAAQAMDACGNNLESAGAGREDDDTYGPSTGSNNSGFVAGQTYYLFVETF